MSNTVYYLSMDHFTLHFDGSCWPNPNGVAAFGFVLSHQGSVIDSGHGVIAEGQGTSNNMAEFCSLYKGLQSFLTKVEGTAHLKVYGDSNLVVQIMNRKWGAKKDKAYWPAYDSALSLTKRIRNRGCTVTFDWIPREQNVECDKLSKAHNSPIK